MPGRPKKYKPRTKPNKRKTPNPGDELKPYSKPLTVYDLKALEVWKKFEDPNYYTDRREPFHSVPDCTDNRGYQRHTGRR